MNSKSIVLSVKPRWCDLILSGRKGLEVRRGYWPKNEWYIPEGRTIDDGEEVPRTVYLYRSGKGGAIVGEFKCLYDSYCYKIDRICAYIDRELTDACMTRVELLNYIGNRKFVHGIVIKFLQVYAKPRALADVGLTRAPQSWCYARKDILDQVPL